MRKGIFFLVLFSYLFGNQVPAENLLPPHAKLKAPWFTGPLITPSPVTVPPGLINIEPYIFAMANTGRYDNHWNKVKISTNWTNFFQPSMQIGVASWLEFDVTPTLYYNYNHGASMWALGDVPISFAIQIFRTKKPLNEFNHAMRLQLNAVIPFGKYHKLEPQKGGTDIGGQGSWRPGIAINWGSLFRLGGNHFGSWRVTGVYTIPNSVYVQGLNAYGGDARTLGTVYPSQRFTLESALEISLTQNWVVVMEAVGRWGGPRHFKGVTTLPMTNPSNVQISLSPAIEYNWSSHIGVIFGSWFTVAGKNMPQFKSAVIAFNWFQ